jgi:uncharacterized protein YbbC (DUF1343 family)
MLTGLDRLLDSPELLRTLRGQRIGLLTHPAAVDARLRHVSMALREHGIHPVVCFGPEHGYGGEAQDMVGVADTVLQASDGMLQASDAPVRVVSLYGEHFDDLVPKQSDLRGLDRLIIDMADVGSRYYTFVWTALLAAEAAIRNGVAALILDRPNPLGGKWSDCEGALPVPECLSFVGLRPVPVRHGLTLGELVSHFARIDGIELGEALQVIGVQGWNRGADASAWAPPFVMTSPNMPTLDTARVYPGGCLLEGTNMSEGRGTTRPFEIWGAPWLPAEALCRAWSTAPPALQAGAELRPLSFQPMFQKFAGKACQGVQVHIRNAEKLRAFSTYLWLIAESRRLAPDHFQFRTERYEFVDTMPAFDLLTGSPQAREAMLAGVTSSELVEMLRLLPNEWKPVHEAALQDARVAEALAC